MAKKEYFSFQSADGVTDIHAVKWIPDQGEYKAVIQIIHGMVEYVERYETFARYLTRQGFLVVGHDHLGHGKSVRTEDDWGYVPPITGGSILLRDMHYIREKIQEENPGKSYIMFGHSMGSYLLRKYLTRWGVNLDGAILSGTGEINDLATRNGLRVLKMIAKVKGWQYRSDFIEKLVFGGPYKKFDCTGKDTKNSWLTRDEKIVAQYYSEPCCTFHFTLAAYYALIDTVRYDNQRSNIKRMPKDLPILLASGMEDPVGDFGKGVRHVYRLFKEAGMQDVTLKLYEGARHELTNEQNRDEIYEDILQWTQNHALHYEKNNDNVQQHIKRDGDTVGQDKE